MTPLTNVEALMALHKLIGDHALVNAVVTNFTHWEQLAHASTGELVFKIGPWATQLKIPANIPPVPHLGQGVKAHSLYLRDYPVNLTELFDAPVVLYSRGNLPPGPRLAVGGSFYPSAYGLDVTQAAAKAASILKMTIVAALDGGCGEAAIRTGLENNTKVIAIAHGDLNAKAEKEELIEQIIKKGGAVVSEWGPGEAWTESRAFASLRIVAALGDAVMLSELGTHPAGGAHLAKATVATNKFMIVPEPPAEALISAAYAGVAIFGRARSFSPKVFGTHPRMMSRVANGEPPADAVVKNEADIFTVLEKFLQQNR